jgi:hypothetical protein
VSKGLERGGTYRIRVVGSLEEDLSERFAGMTATACRDEHGTRGMVLEGYLPDQAALSGVLDMLYVHHLAVVSLELIDP